MPAPVPTDRSSGLAATLRRALLDGALADAGGRLPAQSELAARYGVSRTVVREAVARLAAQGLLVLGQGRRAQLAPADPASWAASLSALLAAGPWASADLLAARRLIEGETAALAAGRRQPQVVADLRRQIEVYRAATSRSAALAADLAFHRCIAAGAGNPVLELLYRSLVDAVSAQQRHTHDTSEVGWVPRDHQRIAAAIGHGDPEAARAAMHRHVDQVGRVLLET